jgi:hypothetical protein
MASDSTATSGTVSELLAGWCESVDPIATDTHSEQTPVIANAETVTNRDRVDEVMLNRIGVNCCNDGARSQKVRAMWVIRTPQDH